MKLTEFRITNFRSINDSGPVSSQSSQSLVGRNESGKTNLLLALRTLNPPGGPKDLNRIKDFPRHRRLSECSDETEVVSTTWELSDPEQKELATIFPRAAGVTHVRIGRRYKVASRWVGFVDLKPIAFSASDVAARVGKILPVLDAHAEKLDAAPQQEAKTAIDKFSREIISTDEPERWSRSPVLAWPTCERCSRPLESRCLTEKRACWVSWRTLQRQSLLTAQPRPKPVLGLQVVCRCSST